ncbi:MAG TPA: serine/threonine-protein kinase [Kofleriaceae bacterium]|nr:serine/threonine-protein kinase [Kofleriaceae bacterium]
MPNGHYQLGELLGQGGMGQVHAARHRSGRVVAVKRVRNTLSSDQLLAERLSDEARLLRAVSHPNVVRALDHGTDPDGRPFLVMDRAHGTPLSDVIHRAGPLPHDRVVAIAAQLFAGLSAIHDAGIVHADLKSHNVLVDEVNIVTIIDFGLARTVAAPPDTAGLIAGTPAYMAPEVIAGAYPTIAADIYAAATILYEMLTGTTPYGGHISTILTRQLSEPVEPPSRRAPGRDISPAIDRVVVRALDPSPDARYPSVAAFADAFHAALAGLPEPIAAGSELWLEQPTLRRPAATGAAASPAAAPPMSSARVTAVASAPQLTERLEPQVVGRISGLGGLPGLTAPRDPADAIISTALAKAQRLIDGRRLTEAAQALEAALAALPPALDAEAPSCAEAWRIETVLAALYDTTGKQERARRLALVAYRHALRSGCELAEARARDLVDRLTRPRRLARGTR